MSEKNRRYKTDNSRPKKRKKKGNKVISFIAAAIVITVLVVSAVVIYVKNVKANTDSSERTLAPINSVSVVEHTEQTTVTDESLIEIGENIAAEIDKTPEAVTDPKSFTVKTTDNSKNISNKDVTAKYSVVVDADTGEIFGRHNSFVRMYPASMTKVMSLIVACEHLTEADMDKKVTMTYEMLAPLVADNASRVGYMEGEEAKVRDMLYGLILPSGADAAVGLAQYVAGSEEEFVKLMNEKCEELGLENTHFENPTGLHSETHYSTCEEMAKIMKAAMCDPLAKEILSTYIYNIEPTEQHPEGITLYSTMFSRMYGTEVEGVVITSGKTGYTDEAGNCLVSYAKKGDRHYICVVAHDDGSRSAVFSTFAVYEKYLP